MNIYKRAKQNIIKIIFVIIFIFIVLIKINFFQNILSLYSELSKKYYFIILKNVDRIK